MASFRGHITFSATLGAAFGGFTWWYFGVDWATAILVGELTAIGGMLPDLDSESGIPVREIFGMAAALLPIVAIKRLLHHGFTNEMILVIFSALYLLIRYGLAALFKHITVHRGMFHSIPAMLIAGLGTFLIYHDPDLRIRGLMSLATMLGFFSHLLLDEIYSVNFVGVVPKLNKFAGTALKFYSPSWTASLAAYALLLTLGGVAAWEFDWTRKSVRNFHQKTLEVWAVQPRDPRELRK